MRIRPVVLVFLALASSGPAVGGADGSFYVTAKLGRTSVEREVVLGPFDTAEVDEDGWSGGVGYDFGRRLAVQAEILDFGAATQTRRCGPPDSLCLSAPPLETETTARSVSLVSRWPIGSRASVFGKVGLARLETEASSLGFTESEEKSLEGHLGAGIGFEVSRRLSLLAEYETVGGEVRGLSLGARFEF